MKTLYLECAMGAAGDMFAAALFELIADQEKMIKKIHHLGVPNVLVTMQKTEKCGIFGTHMQVKVDGKEEYSHDHHPHDQHQHTHHHHSKLHDICHIIDDTTASTSAKAHAKDIYRLIAEAEAKAHQKPIEDIHFHEVGTLDAIADILMSCMLLEELEVDQVIASPVCTGYGHVHCAHGILPIPAPATADLLKGIPVYPGDEEGELCTPTGAALLKYFVDSFQHMPLMRIEQIGYGMGSKDFKKANCMRAILGETEEKSQDVVELCCQIDDMTAEEIAYATSELMKPPVLDVFTIPIYMKKSRPGIMLQVLCRPDDRDEVVKKMFSLTSTLGIREKICHRHELNRQTKELMTPFGRIKKKIASGYGVTKEKIEAEDIMRVLREDKE